MNATTSIKEHTPVATQQPYTTGFVTAKDGVAIGYRQLGHGPGVVMLHGAMESAQSHMQLAEALADAFTVYLPDRRGRGLSGGYGNDYSIQTEVDDIEALLTTTGAHNAFGVSSGGLIMLRAALTLPAIAKLALYEPALIVNNSISTAFAARYDREMAQGKVAAALVTGMKGTQMGPAIFNAMPNWLLERLTTMAMAQEDRKARSGDVTMRALAPTLHADLQIVTEAAGTLEDYRGVRVETLLLGGGKSPAYLKAALDALEKTLPHARRITFPALNHGGSGNTDRGGRPEQVAQELRRFFA